ncbi:sugar nucleotide-binding protein [Candidatus Parcubacteria bacterium]|nr:sugar nucleotide-binding protein [Candidatus Parcubacteria bacterium]
MEKDKVLIFGNGQIGNFYNSYFAEQNIKSEITRADITDIKQVQKTIQKYNPTVVINTAAKTNLEWCGKNRLEAFNVNVLGADNIAQVCDEEKIYFIHFSSGCIFESKDENDEKNENSEPSPAAFYSWTKVWAEQLIQSNKSKNFRFLILRPRQPVSSQASHKNMLMKLLTFVNFVDTPNAGTVLEDLMDWTLKILETKPTGILHAANQGWTTPYQIGLMLKKYILPNLEVNKITKKELDKITPNRRVDTILNVDKLKNMGVEIKPYKERLKEIIKSLGENIRKADKEFLKQELEKTAIFSKTRTKVNSEWKELIK